MRSMMLLVATLIVCLAVPPVFAEEGEGCNVANVGGVYGYVGTGISRPGNALGVPAGTWISVGILNFDGKGNVTITDSAKIDDVILTPNSVYQATYTVEKNCLATITITSFVALGLPGPHFRGVFVDNRRGLRTMALFPGGSVYFANTTKL